MVLHWCLNFWFIAYRCMFSSKRLAWTGRSIRAPWHLASNLSASCMCKKIESSKYLDHQELFPLPQDGLCVGQRSAGARDRVENRTWSVLSCVARGRKHRKTWDPVMPNACECFMWCRDVVIFHVHVSTQPCFRQVICHGIPDCRPIEAARAMFPTWMNSPLGCPVSGGRCREPGCEHLLSRRPRCCEIFCFSKYK